MACVIIAIYTNLTSWNTFETDQTFILPFFYDRMVTYASQYYIHRLMIHKVANYHANDGIQHKMCVQFYCPWFHYWTSQTHIRLPMLMLQWCTADGVILMARTMNIQISSGEIDFKTFRFGRICYRYADTMSNIYVHVPYLIAPYEWIFSRKLSFNWKFKVETLKDETCTT